MDETTKFLSEYMKKLPEDIRNVVASTEFTADIDSIAGDYDLSSEEKIAVKNEAILLTIGLSEPDDFIAGIKTNPEMTDDIAKSILYDVQSLIIAPIQDSLMVFVKKELSAETTETMAATGSGLAITPNSQPYTGGGLKSSIPVKDINPFLPPLNKNLAVPRIVVPPNVTVSSAFSGPAPAPLASELQSPLVPTGEVVARAPEKTTPVTSALAAEIGNLLEKKVAPQTLVPPQPPKPSPIVTTAPIPKGIPPVNLPIASHPDLPSTTVIPPSPKPTFPSARTPAPGAPVNKLNSMTQKPRVEVEMIKTAPDGGKPAGDPYREPVL